MSVKSSIDPAQAFWDAYQEKVSAWEAAGTPFEGESVDAMEEAEERFINHRTTSLLGIRLSLCTSSTPTTWRSIRSIRLAGSRWACYAT